MTATIVKVLTKYGACVACRQKRCLAPSLIGDGAPWTSARGDAAPWIMLPMKQTPREILSGCVCTRMDAGGAQRIAWSLLKGFANRGHTSKLVFLYTKRPAYPVGEDVSTISTCRPGIAGLIGIVHRLRRMFRQHRPDAVISHTPYSNVIVLPLAWLTGIPVRVAVHHSLSGSYSRLVRRLDRLIGATSVYVHCVAVSEVVKSSFQSYSREYRKKLIVVPNGVESVPDAIEAANSPFARDVLVLLNVGRLSRSKRHSVLIDIVERLPHAGLIIIGDGELREELEDRVHARGLSSRIWFSGVHDHDVVWSYLKSARVFVFTSRLEGLSLALAEAMSVGLPIVASDIPQNREVLTTKDGKRAGILVEPDNVDVYVSAVKTILDDPAHAGTMSGIARQRARELDLDVMIDRYASLLVESGES